MVRLFQKNSFFTNTFITSLPGILSIFLSLISIPIYLNEIGIANYGNYIIQHFILTISFITNLNFGKIISIRVPKQKDKDQNKSIFTIIIFSIICSLVTSFIVYLLIQIVATNYFSGEAIFKNNYYLLFGLILSNIFLTLDGVCKSKFLFKSLSFANFIFYSLSLSLPAFFIFYNEDLINNNNLFKLSVAIKSLAVIYLILLFYLKKFLISKDFSKIIFSDIKKYSKWMTLTSLLDQIYDYLDKYVIKFSMGSNMMAIYSVPQQIAAKLHILSNGINAVLLPKISKKQSDINSKNILSASIYGFFYLISFFIIIILPFLETILNLWLGEAYAPEFTKLFKVFFLLTFIGCISHIIIVFFESRFMAKLNSFYESVSIVPFLIGLSICIYYKNIYLFAFLLLIKESILYFVRIIKIKSFVKNYIILNIQMIIVGTAIVASFLGIEILFYLCVAFFFLISIFNFPLKLIVKEFSK